VNNEQEPSGWPTPVPQMFKVGDAVRPKNTTSYRGERRGRVVELSGERVRVLWEANPSLGGNQGLAKRTWFAQERLMLAEPDSSFVNGGS